MHRRHFGSTAPAGIDGMQLAATRAPADWQAAEGLRSAGVPLVPAPKSTRCAAPPSVLLMAGPLGAPSARARGMGRARRPTRRHCRCQLRRRRPDAWSAGRVGPAFARRVRSQAPRGRHPSDCVAPSAQLAACANHGDRIPRRLLAWSTSRCGCVSVEGWRRRLRLAAGARGKELGLRGCRCETWRVTQRRAHDGRRGG